jgi:adenylate cyclase
MQKSYYQQLPLMPLGPGAIGEMLGDLLGSDPSLDGLPERIRERTAGNPFFIEEVVQALAEAGGLEGSRGGYRLVRPVEEAAIPATVQAVLASRIDRLGEREKTALQTAAVIGKEFGEPVLRRVAGIPEAELAAALRALIAAEFVYEEQLYPEAAYVFKHPLTQEVAYRAQLAEHRARLHAAVAQVIEELHPEKLDEKAALLAHHWEAAGQALDAARWHERAARWAALNNPREAQRHSQRVRELVKTLPESPERGALHVAACTQLLNLAMHLGTSAEEASVIRAEGKAVAERSGDLFGLAGLAVAYVWADISAAFEPDALEPSREAARLAEQTGDLDLRVTASCGLAFAQMFVGNCREALALTERAIELSSKESTLGLSTLSFSSYLWLVWFRGQLLVRMGRLTEAAPALGHASELARELGDVRMTGFTHNWLCQLSCYAGDAAAALGHARRGLEIAEKIASPFSRVIALLNIGRARLVGEEWHEAAAATEEALALARERRTALQVEMLLLADLAVARLGCGEGRAGLAAAEEALAIARRRAAKTHEIEVRLALARALIHTEGLEARGAVEAELSEASALIETTGQRAVEPYVHVERAELARLAGDEDGRRRELREAHRLFTAMGATGHAERLAKEALG